VHAGTLYYTSLNAEEFAFASYEVEEGAWRDLAAYDTETQMASDKHGNLYAYDNRTDKVQLYAPEADTWVDFMEGPGIGNAWGTLEVTRSGRFLYTRYDSNVLSYSDGEWSTVPLPFAVNAMGDYDPVSNRYVVGETSVNNIHMIDVETFAITNFISAGYAAEFRRMGSILDGFFFENTGSGGIRGWGLADPSAPSIVIPQPAGTMWLASARRLAAERGGARCACLVGSRGNLYVV